ncbi:hypothetical protein ACWCQZ_08415 [Streptomyces sp. NPDC002285]
MAQHLRFVLDGDDQLSPVLNNAGDASVRLHRRLNDDMNGNAAAVRRFTTDANGRLRDLNGRFVSAADAARLLGDGMPDLTRRLGDVSAAGADASASLGRSGGGLSGTMIALGASAGLSLLPALGALVPMMAGAGLAAGTLKLGFAGVSEAVALAGEDTEKYNDALKKMGPEQRDFTKSVVGLKKEFGGIGKEIQKAMLPGFTKAVKDAEPVVKILGRGMTELGGAFGEAAEGAGRMMKDAGFQDDLQQNLRLGSQFVREMTGSLGPFTRALLDFGAASGPTLKSFSDGLGGLLAKGLPDMFRGLESGIPGTAKMLDGLFAMINDVLGGVGRLAGELGRTLGPVFGEQFKLGGSLLAGAMDTLRGALILARPVIEDIGYGFKTILDVGRIVGPTLSDMGGVILSAFAPVGSSVDKAAGPLQRLNNLVNDNKGAILEGGRVFAGAMLDMTGAAIAAAPTIIRAFTLVSTGILTALGGIVQGAASAFGWIPGIGDKLKSANRSFQGFKEKFVGGLITAEQKSRQFADEVGPKLSAGKLKLNINNWQEQIAVAKAKLKSVPPGKQAALKATIADLERKVRRAKGELDSLDGKTAMAYVNVHYSYSGAKRSDGRTFMGASGRLAAGGPVRGPGTTTSDSVPIMASDGEYVINAKSTAKHRGLIEAINEDRLGEGYGMPGAGAAVASGLISGMTGGTSDVRAGARVMAAGVTAGIREELEIRSPSKKTKALAKDVAKGFLEGLTGSRDKIKSVAADLVKDIRTAFSGKKESGLVKMVNQQSKKLLDLAAKRDAVAKKIAEAKQFRDTVMNTARGTATLGSLGIEEGKVTAGGIKGAMGSKLAQIKTFTSFVKSLAARGLHKTLLRQILEMGPEAGYAYANALAGADKGTLSAINKTQHGLDKATRSLGEIGADRLYDSGKNASKGFLKGLESQEKDIEKLMMKIAKAMQKSLRKALGISSPARKMIPDGVNTMRGVALGVIQGLPHIDGAMQQAADRMSGIRPATGRAAVIGRGGGGTVVHIHVDGAVVDKLGAARAMREAFLELKRAQGGGELGIA